MQRQNFSFFQQLLYYFYNPWLNQSSHHSGQYLQTCRTLLKSIVCGTRSEFESNFILPNLKHLEKPLPRRFKGRQRMPRNFQEAACAKNCKSVSVKHLLFVSDNCFLLQLERVINCFLLAFYWGLGKLTEGSCNWQPHLP